MNNIPFYVYLIACAGVTYLVRMIPLVLIKKPIKNRFLLSFLYYMPFAVLSVMTVPYIFYSTSCIYSAVAGFVVALFMSFYNKSLLLVASCSCLTVFIVEMFVKYIV